MRVSVEKYGFLWFTIYKFIEPVAQYHLGDLEIYNQKELDHIISKLPDDERKDIIENSRLSEDEKKIANAILSGTYTEAFNKKIFCKCAAGKLKEYGIDITKALHKDEKDE